FNAPPTTAIYTLSLHERSSDLAYLLNAGATVQVAYSKDGGLTFTRIPDIAKPAGSNSNTAKERGLFRYTDQPTIATGHGDVWVRSEEHTSELQSRGHLVCRLLP